jgi:hypothetical protein
MEKDKMQGGGREEGEGKEQKIHNVASYYK